MKTEQESNQAKEKKPERKTSISIKKFILGGRRNSSGDEALRSSTTADTSEERSAEEDPPVLGRSASDTNLAEKSWESDEDLRREELKSSVRSVISGKRSLENLKVMPAYGELILDSSIDTVNLLKERQITRPRCSFYCMVIQNSVSV